MVKVPVFHEIVTSGISIGALVTGDVKNAKGVWKEYAKESVIGSTVKAGACAYKGEHCRAKKAIKGAGRATGHALAGGGLLPESVPIFKEFNKAGKAFGDVITGDLEQAKKRFTEELKNEYNDPKFLQTMTLDLAATSASVVITISTAGLGTPAALVAAHATGAAATSIAVNTVDQGIDIMVKRKDEFDTKRLLSKMVENCIVGGISSTVHLQSNGAVPDASVPFLAEKIEKNIVKEENKRGICVCIPNVGRQFSNTSKVEEKDSITVSIIKSSVIKKKVVAEQEIEAAMCINAERCNKNDRLKDKAQSWKRKIEGKLKRREERRKNSKQIIDEFYIVKVF